MIRQVDVKALISHVIRGDGLNKCRICMRDTSEGQVHLSDIVIMEGDKPVTLSEMLEVVAGIQVPQDGDLPAGVCMQCCTFAVNAANFRSMCRETASKWDVTLQLLYELPSQCSEKDKIMFVILDDNQMIVVIDQVELCHDTASERLRTHLNSPSDTKSLNDDKEANLVARDETELTDNKIDRVESKIVLKEEPQLKERVNNARLVAESGEVEQKEVIKNKTPIQIAQCPNCNKKFHHPLKLYEHLKGSVDATRVCHMCSETMSRNDLVSHLDEIHHIEIYDCKKCPALFLTNKKYMQHLTKAHLRGAHLCIDCGKKFQSNQALSAHWAVHRRKTCPSCKKIFQNQSCYSYHVQNCTNLNEKRNFKPNIVVEVKNKINKRNISVGITDDECSCDYCGKSFAKKRYVKAHIQIVHMKTTHAPCAYCGKFLATAYMTEHLKTHELDLSYTCKNCGIVLKSKLGYVQHLRLHTGERPYACKICQETFNAASRRSVHMRKVHQSPDLVLKNACKLCPAKFRLPFRLRSHMKSVHMNESEETQEFECSECHERFGSCRGLLHHSRKHQKVDFPHKRPEKTIMLKVFCEPDCIEEK